MGMYLRDIFQQRKEFGRLLCVLADVERQEREARHEDGSLQPLYADTENVERVRLALQNCLQHLEQPASQDHDFVVRYRAVYKRSSKW